MKITNNTFLNIVKYFNNYLWKLEVNYFQEQD